MQKWYWGLLCWALECVLIHMWIVWRFVFYEGGAGQCPQVRFRQQLVQELLVQADARDAGREGRREVVGHQVRACGAGEGWEGGDDVGDAGGDRGAAKRRRITKAGTPRQPRHSSATSLPACRRDPVQHWPSVCDSASRLQCVLCARSGRRALTRIACTHCGVPLCLNPDRNCFAQFHVSEDI